MQRPHITLPLSISIFLTPLLTLVLAATVNSSQSAGTWTKAAPAPTARTEVAVASLDGKIYVVGGFKGFGATSSVEVYDPSTNRWTEKASLPAALHHAGIGAANGKLYVVGGVKGSLSWTAQASIF